MTQYIDRSFRGAITAFAFLPLLVGNAQALLHGDCNDDGEVAISELQRCANIYLGTQSLELCLPCDFDGSDEVEINEVQGVANCYLDAASIGCRLIPMMTPQPTNTPVSTSTSVPTSTPQPTDTMAVPTDTSTPQPTDTVTPQPTHTATPQPTDTATAPIPTNTMAATPTATQGTAVCGNSQIEPGETCDDGNTNNGDACPSTCAINTCSSAGTMTSTNVNVQTNGNNIRSITVLLDYPDGTVNIPGTGADATVLGRVTNRPSGFTPTIVDLNYALFTSFSSASFNITNNQRIFVVNYDRCQGAPLVTPADFNCTVQEAINSAAANVTAMVTCSVAVP